MTVLAPQDIIYEPGLYWVVLRDKKRTNHERFETNLPVIKESSFDDIKKLITEGYDLPKKIDNYRISIVKIVKEQTKEPTNGK